MKRIIITISLFLLMAGCAEKSANEALEEEVMEMMGSV